MEDTMRKKRHEGQETFPGKARAWTAGLYLILMLGLYPLFQVNGYLDLVYKKWAMFLCATAVAVAVSFICYLLERAARIKHKRKAVWLPMDWFVAGYFVCAVISYVGAADKGSALWGVDTWYTGFAAQALFAGIYFMISTGYVRVPFLDILGAAAGTAVAAMILLQRFGVDVFHFYRGFGEDVKLNFVATLGQVTWTSSYISILLIAGIGFYFAGSCGKRRILWGICIGIGFAAEIVLNCDSGIIALAVAFLIMIWLAVGDRERTMRLMEIWMIALFSAAVTGLGERVFQEQMVPIDAVYLKAAQSMALYPVLAVTAFLYWLVKTDKIHIGGKRRGVLLARGCYLAAIGLGVLAVVLLFILHGKGYFNGSPTENYFRFTVWWGNSRGFIWRTGAAVFGDFGLWRKLFGCGPDGFTPYAYHLMGDAINEFWHNQIVPNVHNEWFNAVINYGMIGGAAYLGIFISSAWECMKRAWGMEREEQAVVFGCGLAAAGYIAHNVLCYQQIIGTPLIFILTGIGVAKIRRFCRE